MLREAFIHHEAALRSVAPALETQLELLQAPGDLTPLQALSLTSFALEIRPDLIIELGTGTGNSAAAFATALELVGEGEIVTFDLKPHWKDYATPRLKSTGLALDRVRPEVGNLTEFDFRPLVAPAERVLVFWDAHGFDIAQHVLGHLMPAIADKRHVVVCHDITDNRFAGDWYKEYGDKRIWRGMSDWFRNQDRTQYVNLGWASAIVDQVIPIIDFCWRNDLELHSADYDLAGWRKTAFLDAMEEPYRQLVHLAYFSMNETSARRFPRTD